MWGHILTWLCFCAMADADDIAEKAAEVAASGISNATVDGTSVTAQDPEKLLNVADRLESRAAATKPHLGLRFTRIIPGGGG